MKRRIAASLLLLAFVLGMCPMLAFATDSLQATQLQMGTQGDGGDEGGEGEGAEGLLPLPDGVSKDLSDGGFRLTLDGSDDEWMQFYIDGENGSYTPQAALYYEGELIDQDLYDLQVQKTWYDEDLGREVSVDLDELAFDLADAYDDNGVFTGIGAEFVVRAVPSENSPFEDETDALHVNAVDSHTFNYHAKKVVIEGGHEAFVVPSWHNGFMVSLLNAADASLSMRDDAVNADGDEIDPDSYSVTYYTRKAGPYNPQDEHYGEDIWVADEAHRLDGFPTAVGTYFAVIEGTDGGYYGSTVVDFDVVENLYMNPFFEQREFSLFADETKEVVLNVDDCDGLERRDWFVHVRVGIGGTYRDAEREFSPKFENDEYSYNPNTHTVTLKGPKLMETLGGPSRLMVRMFITADKEGVGDILAQAYCPGGLRGNGGARYDDMDSLRDRTMLPGWDEWIARYHEGYFESSDYPDGMDFQYEVTSVTVSDEDVLDLEEKEGGWRFEAKDYGTATVTVEYRDPLVLLGQTHIKTFEVCVASDVYEVRLSTVDGASSTALPGKTIALEALASRENEDDDDSLDDVIYEWSLEDETYASIEQDEEDPERAIVTFAPFSDGVNYPQDVKARVRLCEEGDEGESGDELASGEINLTVSDEYIEIIPVDLNRNLDVGASQTEQFKLRHYSLGEGAGVDGYIAPDDVSFRWYYDDEEVQVLDANGEIVGNEDDLGNYCGSEAS